MQIYGPYDYYDSDDDNDGIPDADDPDHPSNIDTDGDGLTNDIDLDDDNDGILPILDYEEVRLLEEVTEKPKDPAFLDCKISIYSKTYNRGDSFTLEKENSNKNQTLEIEDLDKGNVRILLPSRIDFHIKQIPRILKHDSLYIKFHLQLDLITNWCLFK